MKMFLLTERGPQAERGEFNGCEVQVVLGAHLSLFPLERKQSNIDQAALFGFEPWPSPNCAPSNLTSKFVSLERKY